MDSSIYEKEIKQLIDDSVSLSVSVDADAPRVLRKLERYAKGREDRALLGFVYFYQANWHYDSAQYDLFQSSLKKSVQCLLRSGENELLARAYNFFGSDAQENGAYDIAYSYYNNALHFLDEDKATVVAGITLANLGGLHYDMGDYLQARRCFRKAIRLVRRESGDPFYHRNSLVAYINDGVNSIAMGDIAAAEKAFRNAQKTYRIIDDALLGNGKYAYLIFEAHLALAQGHIDVFQKKTDEILRSLIKEEAIDAFMDDVHGFGQTLMEGGQIEQMGRLIREIRPMVEETSETRPLFLLAEMQVAYYERIGNQALLTKSLRERHHLRLRQLEENRKIYKYSLDLVKLVGDLQEEERRVRLENEDLQTQVVTDALTQIPNRYAMEKELDAAVQRLAENRGTLAVVLMDIDDFKHYNDSFGHREGDRCLEELGKIMAEFCRDGEIFCARYGGDEFVMIYEAMEEERVLRAAEQFGETVKKHFSRTSAVGPLRPVTISQGICMGNPEEATKPWDYLALADAALYEAKDIHRSDPDGGIIPIRRLS